MRRLFIFEIASGSNQRNIESIISVRTHLGDHWPFHPENVAEIKGIVFRIAVQQKTGRFELNEESPAMQG